MEHKLTEEVRRKMLGLMPFTQGGTIKYSPEVFADLDIPEDFKPVFEQRAWTKGEYTAMRRETTTNKDYADKYGRMSVVGWEKVYDLSKGELIPFEADETGAVKKELYDTLTEAVQIALFKNACKISGLYSGEDLGLKS